MAAETEVSARVVEVVGVCLAFLRRPGRGATASGIGERIEVVDVELAREIAARIPSDS
ncbi:hypothetical protein [Streptomyces canarius]